MPAVSTVSTPAPPRALATLGRFVPPAAAVAAGAGPVILLGFSQGGYPVHVVAGYGVALWWLLLVGILTQAIPRPRPTGRGWAALTAVSLLAAWGLASLGWSADAERGLTEVARAIVVGGSLLLGMSAVRAGQGRALAGGVLLGLSVIVGAAAVSRLQPELIAASAETASFLSGAARRTSWPLNYWNTIAAAAAVAIPLALALATRARSAWLSGLAVAPVPVLALGLAFTLSRGGIVALAVGLVAAVALTAPRPVLLRTMVAPALASAIVLLIGLGSDALANAVGGAAQSDAGRRVLVVAALATLGTFLVQAGLASADAARWTPRIPRTSRRTFAVAAALAVVALTVGALAAGVPDRASDAWDRFQEPIVASSKANANTIDRLGSISSNGRAAMWGAAIDAFEAHPLKGVGLGSWESWWNPRRAETGFVRNAHSQPLEQLAETGLVGALLFLVLIGAPLGAACAAALRRRPRVPDAVLVGPPLAAFAVGVAVDWHWQITAFAVAAMTLAAVGLARDDDPPARPSRPAWSRGLVAVQAIALAVVALGSIAVLAVALVAPQAVEASREAAARGDLAAAARAADDGAAAASFAASPLLQRALVAEQAGDLRAAASAATAATQRTPADWRPWFVLARVEAARGASDRAVRAFREARRLNPRSPLLR